MASAQPPNQLAPAIDQAAAQSPTASTSTAAPAGDGPKAYPPSATALLMVENPSLSRSAAKKLLREQAWIAGKADRRAKERERNKAKAAEKRKLVEDGVIERPAKRGRLPAKRAIYGARVVIDLGFDDLMIDKEVKSMCSQLGYCYSSNRNSPSPVPLLFTSYNKRLRDKLETMPGQTHKAWRGVEWWEEDYTRLWKGSGAETATDVPEAMGGDAAADPATDATPSTPSPDLVTIGALAGQPRASCPQAKVVYLTGDSPNVLSTLDEGTTYILGGIVDHNRYKSLCLNKAVKDGVAHAQLPIGDFLPEMKTRKVLTVNQVLEIITEWVNRRDKGGETAWRAAFEKVIPLRKMDELHRVNKRVGKPGEEEAEEEEQEQEEGNAGGEEAAAEVVETGHPAPGDE